MTHYITDFSTQFPKIAYAGPGVIPSPTAVATWLTYYRAEDLPDDTTTLVGAADVGPPVVAPWPRNTDVGTGGSSFDLAADSGINTSKYMANVAAAAGVKHTTRMGSTNGNNCAGAVLTGADLTAMRACQTGSLAVFANLFSVGDVRFFGITSQYSGNRSLMLGCQADGSLYVRLSTPQGASALEYEYWQSAETGIVTTGYHAIAVSQTGDGAADNPMIGYVDGVRYELVHNAGTAGANADRLHWIKDIDTAGAGADGISLGGLLDDNANPFIVYNGTDAYWFDAGLTVDGSVLSTAGARKLSKHQHYYYGK